MQFLDMVNQSEALPELSVERIGIVTLDIEATAFRGTLRSESSDNDVSTRLDRFLDAFDVGGTIGGGRQEMKNRAVVPNVIGIWRKVCPRNIGYEPFDAISQGSQPRLGDIDRGLGNVKDREVAITACEQVVNQCGFAASNIDNSGGPVGRGTLDE